MIDDVKKIKILVIDDEPQIRRFLRIALLAHHFEVVVAGTGQDGQHQAALTKPDLIILDLGLPDMDGKEILLALREWSKTPIIILSVRNNQETIVELLNSGADDYILKPFNLDELIARINVALRHVQLMTPSPQKLKFRDGFSIDFFNKCVYKDNNLVQVTKKEYVILAFLAINNGKVVTQQQLLHKFWGEQYEDELQYLRVYIKQLRKKIEQDPHNPQLILTEFGVGYRFVEHLE